MCDHRQQIIMRPTDNTYVVSRDTFVLKDIDNLNNLKKYHTDQTGSSGDTRRPYTNMSRLKPITQLMLVCFATLTIMIAVCIPRATPMPHAASSELALPKTQKVVATSVINCTRDAITETKTSTKKETNTAGPTFGPHRASKLNRMRDAFIKKSDLAGKILHVTNCDGEICITPIRVDNRSN